MIDRTFITGLCLLLAAGISAQGSQPQEPRSAPPLVQEPVQGGWSITGRAQHADEVEQEERISIARSEGQILDVDQEFQHMRMERNTSLARTKGDLTNSDRDALIDYAKRIETAAPNTFEAHMAWYYAEYPAPAAFQHLDRAAMRDPARAELIGPRLGDAARRNNAAELAQWSRAMRDRGGVADGLWRFAEDLFSSVDEHGILVAAGDMDAYPLWTMQYADGRRKDVLVVDKRLLGDPAYRQRLWERAKAKGKVPGQEDFLVRLAGATARPFFLSPALGREGIVFPKEELYVTGLALRVSAAPLENIPVLEDRWRKMSKTTQAGPLSRNYLLPGIVLLEHYRAIQDESSAMRMEQELRALATRLNAMKELYATGLFH